MNVFLLLWLLATFAQPPKTALTMQQNASSLFRFCKSYPGVLWLSGSGRNDRPLISLAAIRHLQSRPLRGSSEGIEVPGGRSTERGDCALPITQHHAGLCWASSLAEDSKQGISLLAEPTVWGLLQWKWLPDFGWASHVLRLVQGVWEIDSMLMTFKKKYLSWGIFLRAWL